MANEYWENRPKEELIAALIEQNDAFLQNTLDLHNALDEAQKSAYEQKQKLDRLLALLKSESVYWALRVAVKRPETTGMDDCEDSAYLELYEIVKELRNDNED